ncbi:MAG: anaerobic ribonucleoside-triphosphate reductase activating protein [Lachnospiraceae bacterium]|nr:anaerobic ribonucleoside-triphosphate reductase activating protein [Lachnospiraceae bacterium]
MNYSVIKKRDIANGLGVRVSIFVSGCTHRCEGCFNETTWDFQSGELFTEDTLQEVLEAMRPSYITGLSLLGGEPFEHVNQQGLLPVLRAVKKEFPQKDIWCYTGYTFETDILEHMCKEWNETSEFLSYIDILVDGEFKMPLKSLSLKFRGSSNQRIIQVKPSLANGETVLDPLNN